MIYTTGVRVRVKVVELRVRGKGLEVSMIRVYRFSLVPMVTLLR